jgi:transposase InsO family protein
MGGSIMTASKLKPSTSRQSKAHTGYHHGARRGKCAARGKRYSKAIKDEILDLVARVSADDAIAKHGVTMNSIVRWQAERERRGEVVPSTPPTLNAKEARRDAVLDVWKEHPGYGPSQVRNTLRRCGFKASVTTVREVMEANGYVAPRRKQKTHVGAYEAARPRELYHLDFYHFHVHKQKQCLLFIEDDFSRFIAGWALAPVEAADPVITCFERAVERYGKPEAVMSDRGAAFHSWRGLSRFQALLEEYEINFVLSTEPQINGKAEALNASFQKECLHVHEFADVTDAARVIGRWVDSYNHQRTHHGLGGLLVPADRFYGLAEKTLKMIEQGQGGHALDILSPDHRGLELFRVVSHGGNPEVYLMGKKILG